MPQKSRREQITIGGPLYEPPLFSLQLGIKILLLGKAARATRAVSSGTGVMGCGRSDMGLLLDQGKVDQDVTLRMPPVKGLRQQYQI